MQFNALKRHYKFPVIYFFFNELTRKFYIGSARNLQNRFSRHIESFRSASPKGCKLLVNSVKKHGLGRFLFGILKILPPGCTRRELLDCEQLYLNFYEPWKKNIGYNLLPSAGSPEHFNRGEDFCVRNRAINIKILSNASLQAKDIPRIFSLAAEGKTRNEIAKIYSVAPGTISLVLNRRCWWHIRVDEELIKAAVHRIPRWTNEAKAREIGDYLSKFAVLEDSFTKLSKKFGVCRKAIAHINDGSLFPEIKKTLAPDRPFIAQPKIAH